MVRLTDHLDMSTVVLWIIKPEHKHIVNKMSDFAKPLMDLIPV